MDSTTPDLSNMTDDEKDAYIMECEHQIAEAIEELQNSINRFALEVQLSNPDMEPPIQLECTNVYNNLMKRVMK